MADLVLAKLAQWGTSIDGFELLNCHLDEQGVLCAVLGSRSEEGRQLICSHEGEGPVRLTLYTYVSDEWFASQELQTWMEERHRTGLPNLEIRRSDDNELTIACWIHDDGLSRQSVNLAFREIERTLDSFLQLVQAQPSQPGEAEPPRVEAVQAAPAVAEPEPIAPEPIAEPEPAEPEPIAQPEPVEPAKVETEPVAPKDAGPPQFNPFEGKGAARAHGVPTFMPSARQAPKVISTLPGHQVSAPTAPPTPAADMKACPNCQGQVKAKARFCTWCGQRC